MVISSGKVLPEVFASPFTARIEWGKLLKCYLKGKTCRKWANGLKVGNSEKKKCAQIRLVSLDLVMDSVKYLRLAVRIRCLTLLRYCL